MSETSQLQAFPFPVTAQLHPSEIYPERRASCAMGKVHLPTGHDAVLLTTYRDTAAALADPRLSHDLTALGSARITLGPTFYDDPTNLLNMEGENHRRIRRIVASAFTPKAAARWQPIVEGVANQLIDELEQLPRPADLVANFCFPLPIRIICRVLGVPQKDAERFREWSNAFVSAAPMTPGHQLALIGDFYSYTTELVAHKRAHPGTDLIDDLIAARDGDDRLSEHEMLQMILGLIAAGNETTSNSLSRYLVALLRDGGHLWQQLVADPELITAAVDELARYTPLGPAPFLRIATADIDLPSGRIAAGETVLLAPAVASRDETAYPDPDAVMLDREHPPSLAFGAGPHTCLGINLALSELRTSLRLLTTRLPGLQMTCNVESLQFSNGDILSSLLALPVDW